MPMSEGPKLELLEDHIENEEEEDFVELGDPLSDSFFDEGPPEHSDDSDYEPTERPPTPTRTPAKTIFKGHSDYIYSCVINKSGTLVFSGGKDDKAFLWDINTGEVILTSEHLDTVTYTAFNHDSTLCASGDMGGYIQVWKIETKKRICEFEAAELVWLDWHPSANVLFAGCQGGHIYMWRIPAGELKMYTGPGIDLDAADILNDGRRIAATFHDGSVRIIDLKTMQAQFTIQNLHEQEVYAISTNSSMMCFTGSSDGTAKLINTQNGKVLSTFICGIKKKRGVESVLLGRDNEVTKNHALTSTLYGDVQLWDLSTETERCHLLLKNKVGVEMMKFNPVDESKIYLGCGDGSVRLWDPRANVVQMWQPHVERDIFDMNFTSDGKLMATSSRCDTCVVTDLENTPGTTENID